MKLIVAGIAIMLLLSFPYANSADRMDLNFEFKEPHIYKADRGDVINVEGCKSMEIKGMLLPVKPLFILLPPGKKLERINIDGEKITIGNYRPVKSEPLIVNGIKLHVHPDYEGRTPLYIKNGIYWLRGFPILVMNIFPVVYDGGELIFYKKLHISIEFGKGKISSMYRGLPEDIEWVKKYVDNPWIADEYPVKKIDGCKYVIITSEKFLNDFQKLAKYREDHGIKTKVVSVEDIVSNSSFWNKTSMFNDTQAKIRNFIRYAYKNWGTDYVLLGGDGDVKNESSNIIPPRYLYATSYGLPLGDGEKLEAYIPSDVYYACLDGNFNADMDDKWGENASGNEVSHKDEADLFAEVWVGRACVDNVEEIENIVNKTISYEENNGKYLMQVLLLGEYLGFKGEAEWGGNYKDKIAPFIPSSYNITKLYDRISGWDKYELADVINRGIHIINHDGHGWTTYALKMRNHDLKLLNNTDYFFLYSQTCLAGSFDNWYPSNNYYDDDSFAEHLTLSKHGAFACIMNSRYGLGRENSTDSPGERYDMSFFKAVFQENIKEIGRANHYSKEENVWRIDENGMRWTYYQTNLFGDPTVRIKEPEEKINVSVNITRPLRGIYLFDRGPFLPFLNKTIIVGKITVIAYAETEPEGMISKVKFYIDGVLKKSVEKPPYEFLWVNDRGKHVISVEAIAKNGNSRMKSIDVIKII